MNNAIDSLPTAPRATGLRASGAPRGSAAPAAPGRRGAVPKTSSPSILRRLGAGKPEVWPWMLENKLQFARFLLLCSTAAAGTAISKALNGIHH